MTTTISNSTLKATINNKGAELQSLQNINSEREYIWEGNPDYWGKHAPILFPIVGTLKNNSYTYNGKKYELPRHGFARDKDFKLIFVTSDKVVFSLQFDANTKLIYPFDFELQLTYELINCELQITYKVINHSITVMPYSIGGHPAFALNQSFETYHLRFESDERLMSYTLENNLLSENVKEIQLQDHLLPLTYSLFEQDALIFKKLHSKQIQIIENKIPILNFKFNDFPNLGIWTPPQAPFICLEPWAGYSDVVTSTGIITEKEGIQLLESNSEKEYHFSIEIL
ncbi:aldose 1-epimerase family protein [Flavobacterium silvisoli]|uniref:Aldose 1-epimerase family protein n=1 Tax=Flavobacterium silvisoli TaxID=2529433 RepID=A0A4Q9YSK3_9FLAO|nr:aldose 1-epimerase family protein [Flavobacterium silvisoli]TBX66584.1 aldose 1-epimerase family protein [Flavobacterium silvisoli]